MHEEVLNIANRHPVRVSKKQKRAFQQDVIAYFEGLGYSSKVSRDRAVLMNENIVAGDVGKAKYIIAAHYDTPARMFLPANIMLPQQPLLTLLLQTVLMLVVLLAALRLWHLFATAIEFTGFWSEQIGLAFGLTVFMLLFGTFPNPNNANDNTSGVCGVLETAARIPKTMQEDVAFILFDHEEMGLLGSAAFFLKYTKEVKPKVLVNMDCIGVGDDIRFIVEKKLAKKAGVLQALDACMEKAKDKTLSAQDGKGWFYPSDQLNFVKSIAVVALKRKGKLLYLDEVHTTRDTYMDEKNIDLIAKTLVNVVENDIAQG